MTHSAHHHTGHRDPHPGHRSAHDGHSAATAGAGHTSWRVAAQATLIADELLSNAVHNAPVDEHGIHYRADLARSGELELDWLVRPSRPGIFTEASAF